MSGTNAEHERLAQLPEGGPAANELAALAPQRPLELASDAGCGVLLAQERAPCSVEGRGARS